MRTTVSATSQSASTCTATGTTAPRFALLVALALSLSAGSFLTGCDSQGAVDNTVQPPSAPALSVPSNGSTEVETALELIWSTASAGSLYDLQVARDTGFNDIVTQADRLPEAIYVLSGLEVGHTYCWRVRTRNEAGVSAWSADFTFTPYREARIAPPPQLVFPPHDMMGLPVALTISWTPVPGALSYDFQVSQEDIFVRRDADVTGAHLTKITLDGLVEGYEYFWRVRSRNVLGVSAWSPVWRFVIEYEPEAANGSG